MELSTRYADWLEKSLGARVREVPGEHLERRDSQDACSPPLRGPRPVSDAELQARWFAGEFGREFVTLEGEPVVIAEFGSWNREAGPVFAGARLSLRGEPPQEGGIEIHVDPLEWDRRCGSPEHETTRLHLFAGGGAGGAPGRVAPHAVTASGRKVARVALDITALEFDHGEEPSPSAGLAVPAVPASRPCRAPLAALGSGAVEELLETAAQYRLCRKAARLAALARRFGAGEALYQALAETLGYRANRLPFTLLAQRFPLALLRGRPGEIEPLLFAGSGFLSVTEFGSMPDDSRSYLRELWNLWWPRRTEFERLTLPTGAASLWAVRGARPANHPQRRVAALAEIVRNWPVIESLAERCEVPAIRAFFGGLRHAYWERHYTLTSRRHATPMKLVGAARVGDMLANVLFPAVIVARPALWKEYRKLPAPASSGKLETAFARLFGPEQAEARMAWKRRLLSRAVFQQGLLQLYDDHCREAAFDCSRCALPGRVEAWGDF